MTLTRAISSVLLLCSVVHGVAQEKARGEGGAPPTEEGVIGIPVEGFTMPPGLKLPSRVDLSPWFPPAGDQREQASCSGWALGYALSTYYLNRKEGRTADTTFLADPGKVFSPSFVYNLTARKAQLPDCAEGVELAEAIQLLCDTGCCFWQQFPYDTALTECLKDVPDTLISDAYSYRMSSPVALGVRLENYDQWRYHLSLFEPIVFLASVGPYFDQGDLTGGKAPFVWAEPYPGMNWDGRVGHIMVCTGYEDPHTFRVLNSWGPHWGDRGYVLIPDTVMDWACSEAYVMQPRWMSDAAPVPDARQRTVDLGRDQRIKAKLRLGEIHATDGIVLRFLGPSLDGRRQIVDYWDINTPDRIEQIAVLENQPTTFKHLGNVYSFTFFDRGRLGSKPRFTLVKEDPKNNQLQRHVDSILAPREEYKLP